MDATCKTLAEIGHFLEIRVNLQK